VDMEIDLHLLIVPWKRALGKNGRQGVKNRRHSPVQIESEQGTLCGMGIPGA